MYNKGLIIVLIGGLLLTFDIPTLKLANAEIWTTLFYRGILIAITMTIFFNVRKRILKKTHLKFINGKEGIAVTTLYATANLTFMYALYNTSTAHLVFILALNPIFTAIIGKIYINEHNSKKTWGAILIALIGIALITGEGLHTGHFIGDLAALLTALLIAIALVITRYSQKDMSLTPAPGSALVALIALFYANPLNIELQQLAWIALNAMIIMPIAAGLLALAPRYVPATQVSMFYLLESALTPIWVWIILGETTTFISIVGGALIISAITLYSVQKIAEERKRSKRAGGLGDNISM